MDRLAGIPECTVAIGRKFYPGLYRHRRNVRDPDDAAEWAESLDWLNNPYDRFLLKREILRQSENFLRDKGPMNIWSFASREEIANEIDTVLSECEKKGRIRNVLSLILVTLPWRVGYKHGRIVYSRLAEAFASGGRAGSGD